MIAEATTAIDLAPILNTGAMGFIVAWFLLKLDPRLVRIEEGQDRLAKAINLHILAMDLVPEAIRRQAQTNLEELNDAEKSRK